MGHYQSKSVNDHASDTTSGHLSEGVTQINDALFQLYAPPEGAPQTQVDIVFFHGLVTDYKDAYWKTWFSGAETGIWPQTLLSQSVPRARSFSVCYDSCIRVSPTKGRVDLDTIAECLFSDVVESAGVGRDSPLILVGHCFGGLVIKQLILWACQRKNLSASEDLIACEKFLSNVSGIFFYATPHAGSRLADAAAQMPGFGPLVAMLRTLNADMAKINENFREWRQNNNKKTSGVRATHMSTVLGLGVEIVAEASATAEGDDFYHAPSDHFSVCKPTSRNNSSFLELVRFIQTQVPGVTIINAT